MIVGYSNDFNSLVAVCDEGSKKGVDKGSTDFVDVNERYVTNGFFYISVEDADKQSNYMGKICNCCVLYFTRAFKSI